MPVLNLKQACKKQWHSMKQTNSGYGAWKLQRNSKWTLGISEMARHLTCQSRLANRKEHFWGAISPLVSLSSSVVVSCWPSQCRHKAPNAFIGEYFSGWALFVIFGFLCYLAVFSVVLISAIKLPCLPSPFMIIKLVIQRNRNYTSKECSHEKCTTSNLSLLCKHNNPAQI